MAGDRHTIPAPHCRRREHRRRTISTSSAHLRVLPPCRTPAPWSRSTGTAPSAWSPTVSTSRPRSSSSRTPRTLSRWAGRSGRSRASAQTPSSGRRATTYWDSASPPPRHRRLRRPQPSALTTPIGHDTPVPWSGQHPCGFLASGRYCWWWRHLTELRCNHVLLASFSP